MFYIACCTLVLFTDLNTSYKPFLFLRVGQYFLNKNKKIQHLLYHYLFC